ncbi:hypothetical protein Droror1_Dr00021124 [Drosera rotundifolia]
MIETLWFLNVGCPCCSWSAVLVGVAVRVRADLRCSGNWTIWLKVLSCTVARGSKLVGLLMDVGVRQLVGKIVLYSRNQCLFADVESWKVITCVCGEKEGNPSFKRRNRTETRHQRGIIGNRRLHEESTSRPGRHKQHRRSPFLLVVIWTPSSKPRGNFIDEKEKRSAAIDLGGPEEAAAAEGRKKTLTSPWGKDNRERKRAAVDLHHRGIQKRIQTEKNQKRKTLEEPQGFLEPNAQNTLVQEPLATATIQSSSSSRGETGSSLYLILILNSGDFCCGHGGTVCGGGDGEGGGGFHGSSL